MSRYTLFFTFIVLAILLATVQINTSAQDAFVPPVDSPLAPPSPTAETQPLDSAA
jgi:hypothetical protein